MKLGARILKTGIAITLAIYISMLLELPSPSFAGIAATFAVQPSIYRSYQSILEQVQANFIGAFFAIVFVFSFGSGPIVIGLVSIIVILINLKLKIETTIPLALVTVIAIMESPDENFIIFALMRFAAIMIGVFASFLINLVFLPPKYETKLYYKIVDNTKDIIQWSRVSTRNISEHTVLKNELERIKENMIKIDNLFLLYKEERNYNKKKQHTKGRKLVLFRQMILTTNVAFETLKKLYRIENEFFHLPKSFQEEFKDILDQALTFHEQILFKYIGKIRSGVSSDVIEEIKEKKLLLTNSFIKYKTENEIDDKTFDHLILLISIIVDYCEQLEHLDKLIDSFQTYHKEDNEVKINAKEE